LVKAVRALDGDLSRERFGLAGYPSVMARWLLASALAERGEFPEAFAQGNQAVRIADDVRHPYSSILAAWGIALVHVLKGELDHARQHLERAVALCRDWTVPVLSPVTEGFLGYVHALSGHVAEGLMSLEQATKAQDASGLTLYHSRLVVWLAEASLCANRLDDAQHHAERARTLTRKRGEPGLEARVLFLLGEVMSRGEPPKLEIAERYYRDALAMGEARGLRPLVARCHEALAGLAGREGREREAREHSTASAAMYRDMGM